MQPIWKHIEQTEFYTKLIELLKTKRRFAINDTFNHMDNILIQLIARATQKDVMVVHHNLYHAQKMFDNLNGNTGNIHFYPQDEFITTEMLAMSEAFKLERLETIKATLESTQKIIITHTTGLIKEMLPKTRFIKAKMTLRPQDELDINALLTQLVSYGYTRVSTVSQSGEFALRGSLIDVFPAGEPTPVRIDFFDDEIDTIRGFNINTQRSLERKSSVAIFPMVEFFLDEKTVQTIEHNVRNKLTAINPDEKTITRVETELEDLKNYQNLDTLSRYMVFSGDKLATISDYLDEPIVIFINEPYIKKSHQTIIDDLGDWYEELGDYAKIGFSFIRDLDKIYHEQAILLNPLEAIEKDIPSLRIRAKETTHYHGNFHQVVKDFEKYNQRTTTIVCLKNKEQFKQLETAIDDKIPLKIISSKDEPFDKEINVLVGEDCTALEWFDVNLIVLNEDSIFKVPDKKRAKYQSVFKDTQKVSHVKQLEKGDHIVHYEHGIGRFLGIETMDISQQTNDYIVIQYRGDDTLYIPVENIHLIQKYVAAEGIRPKLNRLGSADWAKTKQRVRKKAKDIAQGLIKLYAQREQVKGFAFSQDNELMATFEADFHYEETEDQVKAIEEVKQDMEHPRPMDRLICGDVGYGKTEVALRASAKAVLDNKQVAYLAPTTVLARQHYHTFKDRFEKHGIRCALLNRFVTKRHQDKIIKLLALGEIDVVLGTHRLLSKDIMFKDLGLLIIDEEQRFGVEHKETIKTMKLHVDVLSLSATPIPRTLQMAMTGVKQMSLLETPPKNRYPVQTYVLQRNNHVIKDAIERELARKGQIFYLYNRVETIENIQDKLTRLVPDARICYAHGKMNRVELESVMEAFLDHEYDVLVSTTIIETGIDIPNANTLIIHDADQLGLAQLYQIRGRVGRSDRIAYSYLMYAKHKQLSEEATKRLTVIKEFTELGSGHKIAMRDLSIRGAGDILGTEQSGFIDSVGIDMFLEILKEEIDKEKYSKTIDKTKEDERRQVIKLSVSKTIPKTYVEDEDMRIELHRRIRDLDTSNTLILLKEELADRFGKIPEELELYMLEKLYENLALQHDIEKVFDKAAKATFTFSKAKSDKINGERLASVVYDLSLHIHLSYRKERIHITVDKLKFGKHPLIPMVEILESL